MELMVDAAKWSACISALHFFESVLDKLVVPDAAPPVALATLQFCSAKALATHMKMHGVVSPWSLRVDATGICPVCNGNYRSRLRVLNHIRSAKCRLELATVPELDCETLAALRLADRNARRAARRDGYNVPIACGPALSADGSFRPGGRTKL